MRKQIELLKDHPDFPADEINIPEVIGEFNPINDDFAALMFLKSV
jgi:hypothetical protein